MVSGRFSLQPSSFRRLTCFYRPRRASTRYSASRRVWADSVRQGQDGTFRIGFGKGPKEAFARANRRRPAELVVRRGAVEGRNGRERQDLITRERRLAMQDSPEQFHA